MAANTSGGMVEKMREEKIHTQQAVVVVIDEDDNEPSIDEGAPLQIRQQHCILFAVTTNAQVNRFRE